MELDPKQAEERLSNPNNLANRLSEFRQGKKLALDTETGVLQVTAGRTLPRLPQLAVTEIEDKISSGEHRVKDLAKEYGVSQPAITTIKKNLEEKQEKEREVRLREKYGSTEQIEQAVKEEAIEKMMLALGLITKDKLASLKARDLASVGQSMSSIYRDMTPVKNQSALVNLVIYSPEIRSESSYKVIEISSSEPSDSSGDDNNRY